MANVLNSARKVVDKTKDMAYTGLKFGTAVGIGVIGTGVYAGVKAKHSVEKGVENFANGLQMALINNMSFSKFEEQVALGRFQEEKKSRGFNWAMASAYSDNDMQYGG